jgi:hypothetical protein
MGGTGLGAVAQRARLEWVRESDNSAAPGEGEAVDEMDQ